MDIVIKRSALQGTMFNFCSNSFRRELMRGGGWAGSVSLSCSSQIFDRVLDSPQRPLGWCEPEKVVALGGFLFIWVNQVSLEKSFAAGRGRFWLASASGYRPIRRAGERLGLVPDKLLARPFCRALRLGFAGLGFLGFLVAKQPLPKGGRRLGPGGLPESVLMPP